MLQNYLRDFASAVNNNNYSYISSYILANSKLESDQKLVIDSFYKQNIKENFIDFELLDISINANDIIVKVLEVYDISSDKGTNTRKFTSRYKVKYDNIYYRETNVLKIRLSILLKKENDKYLLQVN